jgi:hypothetical protein
MAVEFFRYSALSVSPPAVRPMHHIAIPEGPSIIDAGFAVVRSGKMTTLAGLARQRNTLHLTADDTLDLPTGIIAALIHISPS